MGPCPPDETDGKMVLSVMARFYIQFTSINYAISSVGFCQKKKLKKYQDVNLNHYLDKDWTSYLSLT